MRTIRFTPILLAAALFASGCGSDDDSATEQAATTAGTAAASALEVQTTAPTGVHVDEPLPAAPPKKQLTFLQNELPTSAINAAGYKEAAEALGWDFKVVNIKSTSPGPGVQQAIDSGTDYIAIEALPVALYASQAKAAAKAGIPILSCFASDQPSEANGLASQCAGDSTIRAQGTEMARWTINDAKGKANVALVNLRDIPALAVEEEAWKETLSRDCDACELDVIPITAEQLGKGAVPQLVSSYLQQNPDTNYVAFSFGDPANGVAEALAAGGQDANVKLVGINATKANLQAIVDGKQAAFTVQPVDFTGWTVADLAARLASGQELGELAVADVPIFVLDSKEKAQELLDGKGYWEGPEGFRDRFRELWQIEK